MLIFTLVRTAPSLSRMFSLHHLVVTDWLCSAWLINHFSRVSSQLPPINFLSPWNPTHCQKYWSKLLFYFFYRGWPPFHNGHRVVFHNVLLAAQHCSHLCFSAPCTKLKGCNEVCAISICCENYLSEVNASLYVFHNVLVLFFKV